MKKIIITFTLLLTNCATYKTNLSVAQINENTYLRVYAVIKKKRTNNFPYHGVEKCTVADSKVECIDLKLSINDLD
ncbi:hypothetical protein CH373_14110 [Leptospira perolatii]|uniref:Uncharacterized protein n=1 Tax=Leptospira perolatii TaxID=2023191 RepID=A0A2M9ZKH3_9LEPT|nr:hypothetical protein [Leptospira perolatii]PJZ69403.1 hypothetical protein CH360_11675 [Leptospira perolatii]PJZ72538.1 hypothetical protein CH373_14110 [Leptospira perolatii]